MRASSHTARRPFSVTRARACALAGALALAATTGGASAEPTARAQPAEVELSGPRSADDAGETDWQLVGGLGTWAVGMGLVVTFNYAFFRLNDVVHDDAMTSYRQGVPAGESSCERARAGVASTAAGAAGPEEVASLCDEADAMETLRNLTLPIGLGAAILGVVLIGTSDSVSGDETPEATAGHWRLRVGGGPNGASATAAVSFF